MSLSASLVQNDIISSNVENFDVKNQEIENNAAIFTTTKNIVILMVTEFSKLLSQSIGLSIGLTRYVATWGLSVSNLKGAFLLAFVAIALTQLAVGYQSDRTVSKYGRRKPFILIGHIIQQFGVILLCLPPFEGGVAIFGWFTFSFLLYSIGNQCFNGPFDSMMIESTRDDDEYRKLYTIYFPISGFLGGVVGVLLTIALPPLAGFLSIICATVSLYLLITQLETPKLREAPKNPDLIPSIRISCRTNEFRSVFAYKVIITSVVNIFTAVYGYYLLLAFDFSDLSKYTNLLVIIALVSAIFGIIINIICYWVLQRLDKIKFLLAILLIGSALCFASFFTILPGRSSFIGYVGLCIAVVIVGFPARLVESLVVRDLVVYDSFITGLHRENMYLTAINLPTLVISTLLGAIPVILISFTGYEEHTDEVDDNNIDELYDKTSGTLWMLRIVGSLLCCVLALVAFEVMRNYALNDKIVEQMNDVNKMTKERNEEYEDNLADGNGNVNGLSESQKQQIMHLSVEELGMLSNKEANVTLENIQNYCYAIIVSAIVCCAAVFGTIIVDLIIGNGVFVTLFITLFMISFFVGLFECFRAMAITSMIGKYSKDEISKHTNECFVEYSHYHESLKSLLKKYGIRFTQYMSMSSSGDVSLFSPIVEVEKAKQISGYKRFFFFFACVIVISIVVLYGLINK